MEGTSSANITVEKQGFMHKYLACIESIIIFRSKDWKKDLAMVPFLLMIKLQSAVTVTSRHEPLEGTLIQKRSVNWYVGLVIDVLSHGPLNLG
jgi:hypothetical protein